MHLFKVALLTLSLFSVHAFASQNLSCTRQSTEGVKLTSIVDLNILSPDFAQITVSVHFEGNTSQTCYSESPFALTTDFRGDMHLAGKLTCKSGNNGWQAHDAKFKFDTSSMLLFPEDGEYYSCRWL